MGCRLLYLVGQLAPGGLERQLFYLLSAMDRERYQPAVAVWNFHESDAFVPKIEALGVPVYPISSDLSATAKLNLFRRMVGKLAPEVVHSYSFYTNFAACWSVRGTRGVALGSVRGDFTLDKRDSGPVLGRLSARWPRHQLSNSLAAAETARNSGNVFAPQRWFVVRNGLDLERFRVVRAAAGPRCHIVGVGSLVPLKRWDRLLRGAAELKRMGVDCLTHIAGEGPSRTMLEQQVRELGISDCAEIGGFTEDIPSLLARAAFLVHPSDSEGCPNVVMEAMACGRAVLATDAGDVPALVDEGETGFVVPRGDDSTLFARMVTLATDQELCRRMGSAGRAKAERDFGLDRLVSQTLAAYRATGWKDA